MTRPSLHFTAERGWINDPHGLSFHDGRYHLFHQFVPDSVSWAPRCEWGHATSSDLLAWTRHVSALTPGDGDEGIWTGCVVERGADSWLFYTSVAPPDLGLGRVRVARPDDETWETWTKGAVVTAPPAELDLTAYRDPFVLAETVDGQERWRMFVGAASRSGEAMALTYSSADLDTWTYDGVAAARSTEQTVPVWTGALWECPQVVAVDDHWAMVSSAWDDDVLHHAVYGIGGPQSYRDGRLACEDWGRLSFGASYYAPSVFRDRDGRPGLLFWMRGVGDHEQGWEGCLSVPHLLSMRSGRLVAEPHPEVAARRVMPVRPGPLPSVLDLVWSPARTEDRLVLESDGEATTAVAVADGVVSLERAGTEPWTMPWSGGELRVLVDGPVLEIAGEDGVLGGPIEPPTSWRGPDGKSSAWSLATP